MRARSSLPIGLILFAVALLTTAAGVLALVMQAGALIGVALLAVAALAVIGVVFTLVRPRPTTVRTIAPATPAAAPPAVAPPAATPALSAPAAPPPSPSSTIEAEPPILPTPFTDDERQVGPAFLPAPGPLFVGREQELETLVAGLRRAHGAAAIAVVGPAGAGKHALITQAIEAHRVAGTFPQGYFWLPTADLHGDRGLRKLLLDVLDHLGGPRVAITATLRVGEAAVADLVRGKRMVFWLDDVAADFPLARALTALTARDAAGVGPALIIASRGDWAMPEISEITLDVPQLDEAFDIFREWLELVGRPLEYEEYEAAKAICVNTSHLPLALRLAAGYAAASGVKLTKLAADLGSAVYPPGDVVRTAEQTIAFAESSLFPQPRRAFAALAVFDGPFIDLAQASAVAATVAGGTVAGTRADLEAMVRLGLLEPDGDDAQPSVRLHPLVQHHAAAQLQALGPDVAARARAALASVISARRGADAPDDDFAWDMLRGPLPSAEGAGQRDPAPAKLERGE